MFDSLTVISHHSYSPNMVLMVLKLSWFFWLSISLLIDWLLKRSVCVWFTDSNFPSYLSPKYGFDGSGLRHALLWPLALMVAGGGVLGRKRHAPGSQQQKVSNDHPAKCLQHLPCKISKASYLEHYCSLNPPKLYTSYIHSFVTRRLKKNYNLPIKSKCYIT